MNHVQNLFSLLFSLRRHPLELVLLKLNGIWKHYFELDFFDRMIFAHRVDNSGPQTARELKMKISWPLKGISGRNLTQLQEEPKVTIQSVNGGSNKYSCTSETANPNRVKRQGK